MEYEKQKPLTQVEIDYIHSKQNIHLSDIPHYAKGYIHTEIKWKLPIMITRNEDSFWFGKNSSESNKANYWIVRVSDEAEQSFEVEIKQFKNIEDALTYGVKCYKSWINNRQDVVKNILS